MYTLVVNETLRFNIDGFTENYNKNLNKTILSLFAEDELNENVPLTSLSRLAKSVSTEGVLAMKILVGGDFVLWESSDYLLEDANLSLQKKVQHIEEELIEKDVIVSSLTFGCQTTQVEQ